MDGQALGDTFEGFQKNFTASSGYQRMDELRDKISDFRMTIGDDGAVGTFLATLRGVTTESVRASSAEAAAVAFAIGRP